MYCSQTVIILISTDSLRMFKIQQILVLKYDCISKLWSNFLKSFFKKNIILTNYYYFIRTYEVLHSQELSAQERFVRTVMFWVSTRYCSLRSISKMTVHCAPAGNASGMRMRRRRSSIVWARVRVTGGIEGKGKERKRGWGVAACQRYATLGKRMKRKRTGDKCCLRACSPHFLTSHPASRIRVFVC